MSKKQRLYLVLALVVLISGGVWLRERRLHALNLTPAVPTSANPRLIVHVDEEASGAIKPALGTITVGGGSCGAVDLSLTTMMGSVTCVLLKNAAGVSAVTHLTFYSISRSTMVNLPLSLDNSLSPLRTTKNLFLSYVLHADGTITFSQL